MLEVGRVVKPHGLRGEVIVELFTNRTERVAPGTSLSTDAGPLVVERSSSHHGRWIVQFRGVAGIDAAEALRGTVLSAEPLDDPDALWVHELVGAEVVGVDGAAYGRVDAVEANP
ncbi:MAG: ribosome maturation factor RimM, partial [Actinomycetota bacterium]|nr:ribosome maturation factor RimM [Actinomycetota bacterium]